MYGIILTWLLFKFFASLPVIINVEAKSLKREVHNALNLTVMCVSRKGASTQVEVGNTSQRQSEIAANILAVSKSVAKRLPGGFLNVRGMSLRIGVQPWTVPVYVSYGKGCPLSLPIATQPNNV